MQPVTGRATEEHGAVMVIFAIAAIVIFGFAAIAVDSAHAFVERRDSQAAADVAAIGGALTLIDNTSNDAVKAATLVDEVFRIAELNLGTGLNWEDCADPDAPSNFAVKASDVFIRGLDDQYTECVSWAADWSDVRVRIPTREISTFFGGVVGFDSLSVNAFAEVGSVVKGGAVLPFGILNGEGQGLVCLKTGPQFPDECDAVSSGNFGFLDFRLFGSDIPTTARCTGGSVDTVKENIAHGVDHELELAPSSPIDDKGIDDTATIIEEDEECPGSRPVQAVPTETGNKTKVIIEGFVQGINGYQGRLNQGNPTFDYNGTLIDDVPLWSYLSDAGKTACGTDIDSQAEILQCIADNPSVELFNVELGDSPRLAVVPELWQSEWPTGTKLMSFKGFRFVYIQTLYGGCKSDGTCALEVVPGEPKKITSDDPIVVTALGIERDQIPYDVRKRFGKPTVETYALTR